MVEQHDEKTTQHQTQKEHESRQVAVEELIYWMKSLEHQWFSTMYGVYYFAGSVWTTLATIYVLTALLQRTGHLAPVVRDSTQSQRDGKDENPNSPKFAHGTGVTSITGFILRHRMLAQIIGQPSPNHEE